MCVRANKQTRPPPHVPRPTCVPAPLCAARRRLSEGALLPSARPAGRLAGCVYLCMCTWLGTRRAGGLGAQWARGMSCGAQVKSIILVVAAAAAAAQAVRLRWALGAHAS